MFDASDDQKCNRDPDIDLEIQPGEMVGIVGRSGSGKTTLVNIICRFYDVDEGRALIDGGDIRSIAKDELRSQIGVVLQEPFVPRQHLGERHLRPPERHAGGGHPGRASRRCDGGEGPIRDGGSAGPRSPSH
jgi:ABC-type glutathione transport system ATPase component